MTNLYFSLFLILLLITINKNITFGQKSVTQEEWHQIRFGNNGNQWTVNDGGEVQTDVETPESNSETTETNNDNDVKTIKVGGNNLVLVNDEGTIKMLRANQLPTVSKPNGDKTTTLTESDTYTDEKGSGRTLTGLPLAFAMSSKNADNSRIIYQKMDNNPCLVSSDTPPIYIPAPQLSTSSDSVSRASKMVKIIIEMPESMTKNIDEASRYAATQVKRLKQPSLDITQETIDELPQRKVKKNVHIIRKVVSLEEDNRDANDEEGADELLQRQDNNPIDIEVNNKDKQENDENKYVRIRRNGRSRARGRRKNDRFRGYDQYKKVIKVFRD